MTKESNDFKRGFIKNVVENLDEEQEIFTDVLSHFYSPREIFSIEQLNDWADVSYENNYFNDYQKSEHERMQLLNEIDEMRTANEDSQCILKFFQKHPEFVDNDISRAIYNIFGANV